MSSEEEEILDLVDEHDTVIGTIARSETQTLSGSGGKYVRAANVFIVRSDGKVWVPVRSTHKQIAPGGLDYSSAGHVPAGETYSAAAIREIREETGLSVLPESLELIAKIPPAYTYFTCLFLLRSDGPLRISDEHTAGEWLDIDTLIARLESGVPAKLMLLADVLRLKQHVTETNQVH